MSSITLSILLWPFLGIECTSSGQIVTSIPFNSRMMSSWCYGQCCFPAQVPTSIKVGWNTCPPSIYIYIVIVMMKSAQQCREWGVWPLIKHSCPTPPALIYPYVRTLLPAHFTVGTRHLSLHSSPLQSLVMKWKFKVKGWLFQRLVTSVLRLQYFHT